MKAVVFLVVAKSGVRRHTKTRPSLARDEIAVRLELAIPDTAFRSPIIDASLSVPDEHIIQPVIEVAIVPDPFPTTKHSEEANRG